jgi:hypothetical protein
LKEFFLKTSKFPLKNFKSATNFSLMRAKMLKFGIKMP